jgi:2-iminobutanoate/2-iminopropanoate deaminase
VKLSYRLRILLLSVGLLWPGFTAAENRVEFLHGSGILPTNLPFSEAVRVGDTVYLSGQVGIVPGTMDLVPGGIEPETLQTLKNIETVLQAQGLDLAALVKCTVMLADIADWPTFNTVYQSFLKKPYPARSAFGAAGLALGARVEVECIAASN